MALMALMALVALLAWVSLIALVVWEWRLVSAALLSHLVILISSV